MKNTGDETLTMYLISEPCPEGFRPNEEMLVVDENTLLSATTRKVPALERVLSDIYTMRDELRALIQ